MLVEQKELGELRQQQHILSRFREFMLRSDSIVEILAEAFRLVEDLLTASPAKVVKSQEDKQTLLPRAPLDKNTGDLSQKVTSVVDATSQAHPLRTHALMDSAVGPTPTRLRYAAFLATDGAKTDATPTVSSDKDRSRRGIPEIGSHTSLQLPDRDILFLRSHADLLATTANHLRLIDEADRREARRRESAACLNRAISAAKMSTWEWDIACDTFSSSDGFEVLHGQDAGTVQSLAGLERAVYPEDWPAVTVALDQALRGECDGSLVTEFRVVLSGGSVRWLRATGHVELDNNGLPIRVAGVTQDITISRKAEERIAHMARHDGLTGLLNGSAFRERLEDALLRSQGGEGCAILALDLDRFKDVNDTLGHAVGDAVLLSVASRLLKVMRGTDVLARSGGDEFVVIQFGLHHPQDVETLATRIIGALRQPHEIDGHTIMTGVSIGIAIVPADGTEVEQVLRRADLALYEAKKDDQIRFRFFEPGMQARVQERRQMAADLRLALGRSELELHYQPLVELAKNRIIGFEALVRWRHPVRGLIPPDTFIPLAEETGLIEPIGKWILFKACADAVAWPPDIRVAVNLSVVQFSKGDLRQTVADALERAGLMPRRLELEITESLLLHESEATLATLRHLREYGVSISMDDFGIGYSSLSYIAKFPFDKVKIDRSFVAAAGQGKGGVAIIRAVAELCESLDITTTAEGIETLEQLQQVVSLGCTEGQGYFFASPRPLEDIPALFGSWPQTNRLVA